MKVLIQMGHPAHVHFFKNIIWALQKKNHEVIIVTRKKKITLQLLDHYKFHYIPYKDFPPSLLGKAIDTIQTDFFIYKIAKKMRPDIMMGIGAVGITHIGKILHIPSIFITDTEEAHLANNLAKYFATVMLTPSCYMGSFGKKHIKFEGYKELASLHPNHFSPDPSIFNDMHIPINEKYIVVRKISYEAHHDVGLKGIKDEQTFFKELEQFGRVFINSEKNMPDSLKKYSYDLSPEKFHSLLAYASLYIGEGGTTAAEAAVLGTPSIHIESNIMGRATGSMCGNFIDLQDNYGLLYFYSSQEDALKKAKEILESGGSKKEWLKKKDKLIREKVDTTQWIIDFIEHFPQSVEDYQKSESR